MCSFSVPSSWGPRGDSTGAVFGPLFLPVAVGKPVELPKVQFSNKVTCSSLWCLVPMAKTVQKTCGDSTSAVLGQVVRARRGVWSMARQRRKPVEIPQVQFLDKVSMPVVVAVQMCRKLCSSRRPATCTLVVRLLHGWISLVWTDTCALKCVQNNNNTSRFSARVPILLFESPFETALSCWHGRCWRRIGSRSKVAATAQAVLAPRSPERRNGPCRVSAHGVRKWQGPGRWISRCTTRPRSGRIPPPQAAGTLFYPIDVDVVSAAGGSRPYRLTEVRPQEWVQRHAVEQTMLAPMLDVPVPLMEEQLLVDAFAPHDIQVPEQVIEVPKILIDELSVRTPVREPQLAEQLVEAPSIVSLIEVIRQPVEQITDIPVARGGVRLEGFLQEQGSLTFQFCTVKVFKVSSQDKVHRLRPLLRTFQLVPWMRRFKVFFALFPWERSAKMGPHSGSELGCGLYLIHASFS